MAPQPIRPQAPAQPAPSQRLDNQPSTTRPASTQAVAPPLPRPDRPARGHAWVPPGRGVTVAGTTLRGGLLYVGTGMPDAAGFGAEPALLDPGLPVDLRNPDWAGESMDYWPTGDPHGPRHRLPARPGPGERLARPKWPRADRRAGRSRLRRPAGRLLAPHRRAVPLAISAFCAA
ncbi:TerB N-terminal domain-containing protein [Amycolatopsis sp. DG1A-15b]|uniref:TerB N-terminal domain-containing protein n=1 Tax=Amycolatopsis sp. DG1A-15b TaxID=3052846 RepID=UPI00255BEC61|nr:TerB N-terminal domain-containing protein [Amycolatopsis sp. DG1A-15b]WIX93469.1 TerB N-terminal domain-containing protein [Amycolatopsis sp. DG1A-15b]